MGRMPLFGSERLAEVRRIGESQRTNLVRSVTYVRERDDLFAVLLIGGALSMPWLSALLLPQVLVMGFVVSVLRDVPSAGDPDAGDPNLDSSRASFDAPLTLLRRGVLTWAIWVFYSVLPVLVLVVLREETWREFLGVLGTFPLFSGLVVFPVIDLLGNVESVSAVVAQIRPFEEYIVEVIVLYVVPVALVNSVGATADSAFDALRWKRIEPVLSSPPYLVGWTLALPFLAVYWFGYDPEVTRLLDLAGDPVASLVGQFLFSLVMFFGLVVGFYTAGQAVRDARLDLLAGHAGAVASMFEDPDALTKESAGDRPRPSVRPSVSWLEDVLESDESFERNRGELNAWVRRILPEHTMYRLESHGRTVGHPLPRSTVPLGRSTIETDRGPVEVVVWYA